MSCAATAAWVPFFAAYWSSWHCTWFLRLKAAVFGQLGCKTWVSSNPSVRTLKLRVGIHFRFRKWYTQTHRIHVCYIWWHLPSIYPSHVSIYTSTMDPMGNWWEKKLKKSDLSFQPGNDANLSLQRFSTRKSRQKSGKCRASHVANLHDWGLLGNHLTEKKVIYIYMLLYIYM